MFWKLQNRKRNAFILLEVLTALSLLSFFLPTLFKDQKIYLNEVKKLTFNNELESAFKKHLFDLFDMLYKNKYYKLIQDLESRPQKIAYEDLTINKDRYKTYLILQKEDEKPNDVNYHISVSLEVVGLPLERKSYKSNIQNFYLKKPNLDMKTLFE